MIDDITCVTIFLEVDNEIPKIMKSASASYSDPNKQQENRIEYGQVLEQPLINPSRLLGTKLK